MRKFNKKELSIKLSKESKIDKGIFTAEKVPDSVYIYGICNVSKEVFSYKNKALFGYLRGNWLWTITEDNVPESFYKVLRNNMNVALSVKGTLVYVTMDQNTFLNRKEFKKMGWNKEWSKEINGDIWTGWRCNLCLR